MAGPASGLLQCLPLPRGPRGCQPTPVQVPTSGTFRARLLSDAETPQSTPQGQGRAGPPGPRAGCAAEALRVHDAHQPPWCPRPPPRGASLPGRPTPGPLTTVLFSLSLLLPPVPTTEEAQEEGKWGPRPRPQPTPSPLSRDPNPHATPRVPPSKGVQCAPGLTSRLSFGPAHPAPPPPAEVPEVHEEGMRTQDF